MAKALAFTGHRPESLPFGENELDARCIQLKAMLLTEIMDRIHDSYDSFICGAARGADIIFGMQVLLVKATEFPQIRLICAVPHETQAKGWSDAWKERYQRLLEGADETVLISKPYTRDCYHRRNRYMVDAADAVLSVYDESGKGGTAYTVQYAKRHGKELVNINPWTLERTVIPAATKE